MLSTRLVPPSLKALVPAVMTSEPLTAVVVTANSLVPAVAEREPLVRLRVEVEEPAPRMTLPPLMERELEVRAAAEALREPEGLTETAPMTVSGAAAWRVREWAKVELPMDKEATELAVAGPVTAAMLAGAMTALVVGMGTILPMAKPVRRSCLLGLS